MAARFGVSLHTVQRWLLRAASADLAAVDFSDRSRARRAVARTQPPIEERILALRRELQETSVLGEYGAVAIAAALATRDPAGAAPAVRTIGRILLRRGALDGRQRRRRPAPPRGWYLPDLAAGRVELDSFDAIEGLRFKGGEHFEVFTGISLQGGLVGAWPEPALSGVLAGQRLVEHWSALGRPAYAQFDNDVRFHGSHGAPDIFGPVVRLCLGLGITPVFAPPREMGFQAAVESFNGRWQAKVWARSWDEDLAALRLRSGRYVAASRAHHAVRIEAAPPRAPWPAHWQAAEAVPSAGRIIYLRRTDAAGAVQLLGHTFPVARAWPHRLVRAELDLGARSIRFFALRRREPTDQPLLAERLYVPLPRRGPGRSA